MEPREILVSPGFGAGWTTWNTEHGHGKALAEDSELVRLVKENEHTGTVTGAVLRGLGIVEDDVWPADDSVFQASLPFIRRALAVNGGRLPYFGGVDTLEVVTVCGPYRIAEYDGAESVITADRGEWW